MFRNPLIPILLLLANLVGASLHILATSQSGAFAFDLDNSTFYSPPSTVFENSLSQDIGLSGSNALTCIKTNATSIDASVLAAVVEQYVSIDDVWTLGFLEGLIISAPAGSMMTVSATDWLTENGVKFLIPNGQLDVSSCKGSNTTIVTGVALDLASGPYTISIQESKIKVKQCFRLYEDHLNAFLFGTTSVRHSTAHEAVDLFVSRFQDAWVPVPSRLYSLEDTRPLAGLRLALKDIYDLEGVQTAGGSPTSYAAIYPPANRTAVSVAKLIDMGAYVVGKTKTSQFAHGADPWQFVDTQYPFSPRGDGWLTAASSSAGSACAIAGYDWIDFALGSDTRGSVRKPAAMVGSYGIRPTWNSSNLTGVIPLAHELDTAGFFARDPQLFYTIASLWYNDSPVDVNKSYTSLPKTLIYPIDYFPVANPEAQAHYDDFVQVLENELGMIKTPTNISGILRTSSSAQINNFTAFQLNSNRLAEYISYQEVGRPIERLWREKYPNAGYPPFDPNPRAAFARSVNLTTDDYDAAVEIKNQFREFFLANVIKPSAETCSEGILMIDIGTGGFPSYREQALNALPKATNLSVTVPNGGLANNYLASTAGCPEIGIPIGQINYTSYISLQAEQIPVNVDLIAYPGCDGMLLELVRRLAELGVAKTVKVGKTAF